MLDRIIIADNLEKEATKTRLKCDFELINLALNDSKSFDAIYGRCNEEMMKFTECITRARNSQFSIPQECYKLAGKN